MHCMCINLSEQEKNFKHEINKLTLRNERY